MFIFKDRTLWSVLAPFAVLGLIFLLTGNTGAGSPSALQAQAGSAGAVSVEPPPPPRYIAQVN